MIASLSGVMAEKGLSDAIIDVDGVGYRVHFSLLTLSRLPDEGQPVRVRVRTVVREDALDLFGFLSRDEEELFLLLTSVSHVGPRLALTVLSGMEVPSLLSAIGQGEVGQLTRIRGVGKKIAERLVVELRDKVKAVALESKVTALPPSAAGALERDVLSALVNLGYKPAQAEQAAKAAAARVDPPKAFEQVFREALRGLRTG